MRTYQQSGIVPVMGAAQALAIGSAAAVVLGIVYSFTFYYIPFVYVKFLFAIGFGAGTGWTVAWAARQGKIRNAAAVATLSVVAALAGIYAEWGSTLYALCAPEELGALWGSAGLATFLPWEIASLMLDLYSEGSWGLSEGAMVTGPMLVMLWLLEAGLIIGMAATTAHSQMSGRPFCEGCQEWITGHTPHFYVGDGRESVWTEVQAGNFDPLADTPRATGSEPTYVRLKLHVCDSCDASNYLTITRCENTMDNKGNPKLVETDLVTNLALEAAHVDLIRAAATIAPTLEEAQLQGLVPAGNWTLKSPAESAAAQSLPPSVPPTPTSAVG
jgi:hypothetical protein